MTDLETAVYADILLPGTSFAEKTGTFTNTERRIQMVHQAISPLGDSRPDWQILVELASRIKPADTLSSAKFSGWDYHDTSEIMAEIAALTPIYHGISHARLEQSARLQWPVESTRPPGNANPFDSSFSAGKFYRLRGRFYFFWLSTQAAASCTRVSIRRSLSANR